MTIHVSLPKELENMVHEQVSTGMYQSASEVVREALRTYFQRPSQAEVMAYASRLVDEAKKRGGYQEFSEESSLDEVMRDEFPDS